MQEETLTPPPDSADQAPPMSAALRRRERQERQARVGILRNHNDPPRPPLRHARLMGRWPDLRSARRPHPADGDAAAEVAQQAPESDAPRVAHGNAPVIDIAGLMASVEGLGKAAPGRQSFAAEMRADGAAEAPPPATKPPTKPAILTAEAWLDDFDDPDEGAIVKAFRDDNPPAAPAPTVVRRLRGFWIVLMGVVLAFVVLVLVPVWGVLQSA